jgi:hypothetical protein
MATVPMATYDEESPWLFKLLSVEQEKQLRKNMQNAKQHEQNTQEQHQWSFGYRAHLECGKGPSGSMS